MMKGKEEKKFNIEELYSCGPCRIKLYPEGKLSESSSFRSFDHSIITVKMSNYDLDRTSSRVTVYCKMWIECFVFLGLQLYKSKLKQQNFLNNISNLFYPCPILRGCSIVILLLRAVICCFSLLMRYFTFYNIDAFEWRCPGLRS